MEGLHHQAAFCVDFEVQRDALAAGGYPVVSEWTRPSGARICYIDTRPAIGHMLELYSEDAGIRALYRKVREAAATWDGRELIVPRSA